MGKDMLRPLQICLSKFRSKDESPWIFSCKYPRTESLSLERSAPSGENVVFQRYNSLYVLSEEGPGPQDEECGLKQTELRLVVSKRFSKACEDLDLSSKSSGDSSRFFSSSDSNRSSDLPPGLASGVASQRFFFSPGRSNSILEEAKDFQDPKGEQNCSSCVFGREKIDLPSCAEECSDDLSVSNSADNITPSEDDPEKPDRLFRSESVAVHLNSPNPYCDFRNSMQEMVEAHNLRDWDCLEEMLLCYLSLNHKRTHKFILGAFADLITTMAEAGTPQSESSSQNHAM